MQTLFDVGIEEMKLVRTVHQLVFVHIKRSWTSKIKAKLVLTGPDQTRGLQSDLFEYFYFKKVTRSSSHRRRNEELRGWLSCTPGPSTEEKIIYKQNSPLTSHLEPVSLGVESSAVLVTVLVWFPLVPVDITPGISRHPDPATLVVHVSGAHPPGVGPVAPGGDGEVGVDLVCLRIVLGLGQVGVLEVAALHGIKPVHPVSSPGVTGVAGAGVESLDEHVALVGALRSRQPPVVRVTDSLARIVMVGLGHRTKLEASLGCR